MDWSVFVWFFAGLALLVLGADWLVRGASRIASAAGVSSLVIGLTVVAFGTSAPEMAVSVKAAWIGQADMAVGNAIGSNVFNVLVVLGLSAAIIPLIVALDIVRRDVPIMIALSVLVLLLSLDGSIGRVDGIVLLAGLAGYTAWVIRQSRRESKLQAERKPAAAAPVPPVPGSMWMAAGLTLAGLALLVLGSQWLVSSAVSFAQWAGVSEVVVGLTIVAAGTSLPELATSVVAASRGERDIAVGNVVGSNIFNLMGVLGLAGAVSPGGLVVPASMIGFDMPLTIAVAIACLPIFARGRTIPRWEGILFVGCYVAYVVYLLLDATKHEARSGYVAVMLRFVIPLLVLTLGVLALQTWRARPPVDSASKR